MSIGYLFGVTAVFKVLWNAVHRSGTVKRQCRSQILYRTGSELHQKACHAAAFKLKHARRIPCGKHRKGLGIIIGDFSYIKVGDMLPYRLFAVMDNGKVAKPQKVHFEQSHAFKGCHGVLCGNHTVTAHQRNIIADGSIAYNNSRRMGGGVSWHSLNGACRVYKLMHLHIGLVKTFKLRRTIKRLVKSHMQRLWDKL